MLTEFINLQINGATISEDQEENHIKMSDKKFFKVMTIKRKTFTSSFSILIGIFSYS